MTKSNTPAPGAGFTRRDVIKTTAAGVTAVAASSLGFPAILRAEDVVRLGHITPKSGFLGQLGVYGLNGTYLAVEEINQAGGVMGKKVKLVVEDSVNSGVAVTKVDKLINKDHVAALLGEISSGTALAIGGAAERGKTLYINTGANSDALRGKNCNRYMFHVEGCNTMYTKTIGNWQLSQPLIKGSKWYFLTADYAFGHDLRNVSQRFYTGNGGTIVGDELVPTGSVDFSAYILNIRQAKPDLVYLNLAGSDQTNFLKQFREYNLDIPLSGGVMDTLLFWNAGLDAISGYWQSLWYHGLDNDRSNAFTAAFVKRYGVPPENQAWGDYVAAKVLAGAMNEIKSTNSADLIKHFESGAEFDVLKDRKGSFRKWDHQLLQEMYVVRVKDKDKSKDQWDIFEIVQPAPREDESLEAIQPTEEENPCTMGAI
jgi:branched-chain amino acid transport system substrate-binding protein